MGEASNDLNEFVQEIQNKVSIAVALAVLKTKPQNISSHDYVHELQLKVLSSWQKSNTPDIFEDRLLSHRLQKVKNNVAEMLPNSPTIISEEPLPEDDFNSSFNHDMNELPRVETPPNLKNDVISLQGEYVKALVRLKFAVESRRTVPFSSVRGFLESGENPSCQLSKTTQACQRMNYSNEFLLSAHRSTQLLIPMAFEQESTTRKVHNSVSTSLFKSIVHSSDTEAVIVKGTQSLLQYVRLSICNMPLDAFYRWKSSLMEKTCLILVEASKEPQCLCLMVAFIEDSLDQIWEMDSMAKSYAIENQLLILSQLCHGYDVCTTVLDNLSMKFDKLSESFSNCKAPTPSEIHKIEKAPHFLNLMERTFSTWKKCFQKIEVEKKPTLSNDEGKFSYWRLKSNSEETTDSKIVRLKSWRDSLERLSVTSVEIHPLISNYLIGPLTLMNSLLGAAEYPDKAYFFFDAC